MSWKCDYCDSYNEESMHQCYVCGQERFIDVIEELKTVAEERPTAKEVGSPKPAKEKANSSFGTRRVIVVLGISLIFVALIVTVIIKKTEGEKVRGYAKSSLSEDSDEPWYADAFQESDGGSTTTVSNTIQTSETQATTTITETDEVTTETKEMNQADMLIGGSGYVQDMGDVNATVDYDTGVLTVGTTGMGKSLEEICIDFDNTTQYAGSLQYRVKVYNLGWLDWVDAGQTAGASGLQIEAIEIRLIGAIENYYSIEYSVHIQDYGDMQGWVHDGALAGTDGEAKGIEQLNVRIVPYGSDETMSVKYRSLIKDNGWESGYAKDGIVSGIPNESKSLQGIEVFLEGCQYSGGVLYKTHIGSIGWENTWTQNGEMGADQARFYNLDIEAIAIELYGDVAVYYDIYYRVYARDIGWMSWACNGEYAGTEGLSSAMEGIQIILIPKGTAAPAETYEGITSDEPNCFISSN